MTYIITQLQLLQLHIFGADLQEIAFISPATRTLPVIQQVPPTLSCIQPKPQNISNSFTNSGKIIIHSLYLIVTWYF